MDTPKKKKKERILFMTQSHNNSEQFKNFYSGLEADRFVWTFTTVWSLWTRSEITNKLLKRSFAKNIMNSKNKARVDCNVL